MFLKMDKMKLLYEIMFVRMFLKICAFHFFSPFLVF